MKRTNSTKKLLAFISLFILFAILFESCGPKKNCGTNAQHRQRKAATKKLLGNYQYQ